MAQPTQLTPTEQDALVKQIGLAMLRVAPDDWERLTVDYRAVGRYAESTAEVTFSDGGTDSWEMPADLRALFTRLRGGMYREGRGTWFNARYRLDHPSSYNLEYDREEPVWDMAPPPQAYPDDMRLFPRTDENVPEWLRRRLASAPPPGGPGPAGGPPGPERPRFRVARIFDGPGEDGRPSVNRPPVDEMDIQELLDYLDGGPLVGPARGYDVDRLDPNGQQSVPVAFHTDGTWIWPAAVNYYLREHDISPETDLVDHVRRMRFKLPQVDEQTRSAAQLFLGPPPGPPPGPRPGPPAPAPTRALPVPAPAPTPAPPRAALPSQGPPNQQIDQLRTRLDDLDVPETAYRIGPPTGRGWVMEQTDEGWRVGWYDRDWVAPAMFEDVADASAFLLGKLMLDTDRWAAGPKNPELPPMPPPSPLAPEDHGFEPLSAPIDTFEPMAAPIEEYVAASEFTPPGRPAPAGPVKPPPGTPGYSDPPGRYEAPGGYGDSPGFTEPPAYEPPGAAAHADAQNRSNGYDDSRVRSGGYESPGFTEPSGAPGYADSPGFRPPRPGPPPGTPPRPQPTMAMDPAALEAESRGMDSPGRGHDSSAHGPDSGRGLDMPARGMDAPAHGLDSPGHGLDAPGRGLDSPSHGFDSPGRGHDAPSHGLDSPARGHDAGRGLDSPGRGQDSAGHGMDSPGRGLDSPSHSLDSPGRGHEAPSHGLDSPGRGLDSPGRGLDSPSHSLGSPGRGLDEAGRGLDSSGRGLDSAGRGMDSASHGLDSPGRGLDSTGRGMDSSGRGLDSASHGLDSPGHGMDSAGRGMDSAGRGMDSASHGLDSPGRGLDSAGRGMDSASHGLDSPGRGMDSASHGLDSPGRGLDSPGRGHEAPGRGLDSPPRGIEVPARGGDPTVLARPMNGAAAAPPGAEWPITPLPGEPPLTLFRGKRVIELEPGMEIDRFGDEDGNLVYAAGTPFSERSLVPEWVDRPYHAYRVRQPVQVLTGAAIPWFDQPGGGTAFLLPDAIGELVAHGQLMEITDRERPPA